MTNSRVQKTFLNMKVNMVTYLGSILIAFFTRKVLLDSLGPEFMGLTTTVNSLLGFLNLAELGVGASIAYFLYKPFFADDRAQICEVISIMGFLYRRIGLIILSAGILLSLFLPWVFDGAGLSLPIIYYCFYAQLVASLIGYFVNYRASTIFAADQRQYLVNGYFQVTQFVTVILQAVVAYHTRSYAAYVTISLLFAVTNSGLLNWKFRRVYPWVETSIHRGREALRRRPEIMQYVRRVFIHQVGNFINRSAMPLVIYGYTSLSVVTLYANYSMLSTKISDFIYSALSGTEASIGNLVAEGNTTHTYNCYGELFSIKFFIIAFCTLVLLHLSSPFVCVWLGAEYVLPKLLVWLICAELGLNLLRSTTDQFLNAYGLKADVWVPICRVASLGIMVLTGSQWGLAGILAVPMLFLLLVLHVWKPLYLYRSGFHLPLKHYLSLVLSNALPFLIAYPLVRGLMIWLGYWSEQITTWGSLLVEAALFSFLLLGITALLSWPMNAGLRLFVYKRVLHRPISSRP